MQKIRVVPLFLKLPISSFVQVTDELSLEDENTVSSASLCMSPEKSSATTLGAAPQPLGASTPLAAAGRHDDAVDNDNACPSDALNGNVNTVSESTSMDVLSGGESDAGDTLNRSNNNNSISTLLSNTLREGGSDAQRRRGNDTAFFIARELLMTERTFKRDLELVTVVWSARVSELSAGGGAGAGAAGDVVAALARPCLALEPLALAQGALLARLERALAAPQPSDTHKQPAEEPEYKKIAELLSDYLTNTYDAYATYTERSGALVGVVESVRRRCAAAARACAGFEAAAPLPLACLLLRPLHRLLHYDALTSGTSTHTGRSGTLVGVVESVRRRCAAAARACAGFEAAAPLPLACLLLRPLHRLLHYDALTSGTSTHTGRSGTLVGVVESVRRRCAAAARACAGFEAAAPLPLACLLLRPLHRLLHYDALTSGTSTHTGRSGTLVGVVESVRRRCAAAARACAGFEAAAPLPLACLLLRPLHRLLHYDALTSGTSTHTGRSGTLVGVVESVRRRCAAAARACAGFEAAAPLPLACLLLRPLHRLLHYDALTSGTSTHTGRSGTLVGVVESVRRRCAAAARACAGFEAAAPLPLACLLLRPLHRLLHYDALTSGTSTHTGRSGTLVGVVESVRRRCAAAARACAGFEAAAPLPLACLLLRPLHRLLHYDALTSGTSTHTGRSGALVGVVESVRRRCAAAARACAGFEAAAPLPLACLLLRPLHRLLHYDALTSEIAQSGQRARAAQDLAARLARAAERQLRHVENHAALCQLQRDIVGYDKLLVAGREFIRLGCVYKHSAKGLQQKMLFLFSDVAVLASRAGSAQFRAHAALPLRALRMARAASPLALHLTAAATATANTDDEGINLTLSVSNEIEFEEWYRALELAIENARDQTAVVDTELTPYEQDTGEPLAGAGGGALSHVCWHRATSLHRDHLHTAMRSQASGYLLRKFKNSHGWQKLWVVFAAFTLFFYKSWHDAAPLACLPLLGYTVGAPSESDAIYKDYVFKLQFKNHVYFFRADSQFTYNRWNEVLKTVMVHSKKENELIVSSSRNIV